MSNISKYRLTITEQEYLVACAKLMEREARIRRELEISKEQLDTKTVVAWLGIASSAWRYQGNTKAMTIRDQCDLLRMRIDEGKYTSDDVLKRIDKIKKTATEILNNPFLSTGTEERYKPTPIAKMLSDYYDQFYYRFDHTIDFKFIHIPDSDYVILMHWNWIRFVMDVVVENAANAVSTSDKKVIEIDCSVDANQIKIFIKDSGRGIPSNVLINLFKKPIEKREGEKGQGTGLLIADTIIQAFSGNIEIGDTSPNGTTFIISLPAKRLTS
jgi:C4-dicarboxylate-specific signal transduction histidine kinase